MAFNPAEAPPLMKPCPPQAPPPPPRYFPVQSWPPPTHHGLYQSSSPPELVGATGILTQGEEHNHKMPALGGGAKHKMATAGGGATHRISGSPRAGEEKGNFFKKPMHQERGVGEIKYKPD